MILGFGIGIGFSQVIGKPAWLPASASWGAEFGDTSRAYVQGQTFNSLSSLLASDKADFARTAAGLYLPTSGTYTSFASGAARIGDKGLLIEPSSVNYLQRSQEFNNAWYSGTGINSVVADATTAPDGTTTADRVTQDSGTSLHRIQTSAAFTSELAVSTQYCFSVYAKQNGSRYLLMNAGATLNAGKLLFDLQTGTLAGGGSNGGIEALANGWFRVWAYGTTGNPVQNNAVFMQINNTAIANDETFAGDGVSGFYLWGAQINAGNVPSTQIRTTASSATRDADAFTLFPDAGTYDITVTFDDDSTQVLSSQVITGSGWQIPTNLNRRYIKAIAGAAA